MYFGTNLQFLRRQHGNMTQEKLADRMGVARQTVSKWESGESVPEIQKLMEICEIFSVSLDSLLRQDMMQQPSEDPIRVERVEGFRYASYTVISKHPADDSLNYLSARCPFPDPKYIGWSFPYISQDQKHRFGLRGYVSAVILPDSFTEEFSGADCASQEAADYAVMTIRDPFSPPGNRISQAYGRIIEYLSASGIQKKHTAGTLPCFERVYQKDGITYMDVYIHCHSSSQPTIITSFTQEE